MVKTFDKVYCNLIALYNSKSIIIIFISAVLNINKVYFPQNMFRGELRKKGKNCSHAFVLIYLNKSSVC